jgi:hypothetical protein
MATISYAKNVGIEDVICQGDIFQNVKYCFIDSEDDEGINITEYTFPFAVVISQACDVSSASQLLIKKSGTATKFMPAVLMCPIYNEGLVKNADHLKMLFESEKIAINNYNIIQDADTKITGKDWHYRFHKLQLQKDKTAIINDGLIDFKHYFTVPFGYLLDKRNTRICRLDNVFSEQITLKFCTFLSRVGIPDPNT